MNACIDGGIGSAAGTKSRRPRPRSARSAGEQAAREIRPVNTPSGRSELKLSVEGKPDGAPRPKSRTGSAGFDPYSSDAGYAKPHGWDDVSHK